MTTAAINFPEMYADRICELATRVEREPCDAVMRFEYGMALLSQRRRTEAVTEFQHAVAIRPSYDEAREWLGRTLERVALDVRVQELRMTVAQTEDCPGANPLDWADCADALETDECHMLLEEYFRDHAENVIRFKQHETAPMRTLAWSLAQTLEPGNLVRACDMAHRAYLSEYRCLDDLAVYALVLEAAGRTTEAKRICDESLLLIRTPEMKHRIANENVPFTSYETLILSVLDRVACSQNSREECRR